MEGQLLTFGVGLICAGLLVLIAEAFVVSLGLLSAIGGGLVLIGLVMCFKAGIWWGLSALFGTSLVLPFLLLWMLNLFRKEKLSGRAEENPLQELDNHSLQWLVGKTGKTLTAMAPAGKVDFDGKRIDAITECLIVAKDNWVRCRLVEGHRVVVVPETAPGPQKTFDELDFS